MSPFNDGMRQKENFAHNLECAHNNGVNSDGTCKLCGKLVPKPEESKTDEVR